MEQARRILDGTLLEQMSRTAGLCVCAERGRLVVFRPGVVFEPDALPRFLAEATRTFDLFVQAAQRAAPRTSPAR